MNKPCYNDSLYLHEYSKMIGLKTLKMMTHKKSGKITFYYIGYFGGKIGLGVFKTRRLLKNASIFPRYGWMLTSIDKTE